MSKLQPLKSALIGVGALTMVSCNVADAPQPTDATLGPPLTLPPDVTVPQNFERGEDGLAVDLEAAEARYQQCLQDSGYEPGSSEEEEFDAVDIACREASGTGWSPGNRPDEVEALNEQARKTTECLRERGWEWPDPQVEPLGRYLRVAPVAPDMVPTDPDEREALENDLSDCVTRHAIDWHEWVEDHPRGELSFWRV